MLSSLLYSSPSVPDKILYTEDHQDLHGKFVKIAHTHSRHENDSIIDARDNQEGFSGLQILRNLSHMFYRAFSRW